jgi:hypothetical protein
MNPFKDGFGKDFKRDWQPLPSKEPQPASYIDQLIMTRSLTAYHNNNFIIWLRSKFDDNILSQLLERYKIGTSKFWKGATVFWQVDESGRVCAGKIMLYNSVTGHRIKEPYNHIQWSHKALKLESFNLQQCFFGQHLLKLEPGKAVAIVESEKTAIVASAYLPRFIWLASGSLSNINIERCKPLSGRKIVLFPDLNGFEKWSDKAAEIQKAMPGTRIKVSDLLELKATETERESGLDLCDFLTRFDIKSFLEPDHTLLELIREQFNRMNPKLWIINPEKYPELTLFNLEILSQEINSKNKMNITPHQYLTTFRKLKY